MWSLLFRPTYPKFLLTVFVIYWLAWAWKPWHFRDWLLESILPVVFVLGLVFTRRRFPLSNISYTLIFLFLCLHTVGSHYTYALVPYNEWTARLFGTPLNDWLGFERNHYDRLVHFSFGLLLAYPIREVFLRVAGAHGFWGYYLPLDVTMAFSMLYELIEWAVAELVGGELGQAYLGTQGDIWDAHKDMALASTGALLSMCLTAFINWKFNRHFGEEMRESFLVKRPPLGEAELKRWADSRRKPES